MGEVAGGGSGREGDGNKGSVTGAIGTVAVEEAMKSKAAVGKAAGTKVVEREKK